MITVLAPGSIGTLVGINSPVLTEMVSALGFDFLFLDLEHGSIPVVDLSLHALASSVPILARISECSELAVKQAADSGVDALVVPHVRSAGAARDCIRWGKYPPEGERSVGLSRNTLLGYRLVDALRAGTPQLIAQIEDAEGIADAQAICDTPGIAGVFIGPFDLSASLGLPGQFDTEAFRSAVASVIAAAHERDLSVGIYAPSIPAWEDFKSQGCDFVVFRSDSLLLADGAASAIQQLRY